MCSFYESDAWVRVRYKAIKKSNGRCECCGHKPSNSNPLHVDHIKARSRYPELELDPDNLQVLCRKCNIGKGAGDETNWKEKNVPLWTFYAPDRRS